MPARKREFQSLIGTIQTLRRVQVDQVFIRFQSLIGTIQTPLGEFYVDSREKVFQSLIGTIQTWRNSLIVSPRDGVSIPHRYDSNSDCGGGSVSRSEFQSLIGTIQTQPSQPHGLL